MQQAYQGQHGTGTAQIGSRQPRRRCPRILAHRASATAWDDVDVPQRARPEAHDLAAFAVGRLRALAPEAGRVALGISGGGDSVALAWMLHEAGVDLALLHVDHALRDDAADDAEFVRGLAATLGVPYVSERVQVRVAADRRGWNLEDAARRLRRAALHRMARRTGTDVLVLAHTVDDQAETVLLQALRGAAYLGGMPERHGRLVRPLLAVGRGELRAWLDHHGRPWRDDPTNADLERSRAWVRHAVLPRLEAYAPGATHRLARLAIVQRDLAAFVRSEARRRVAGVAVLQGPERSFGEDDSGGAPLAASAAAAADGLDARALARQPIAVQREALAALLAAAGVAVEQHRIEAVRGRLTEEGPWRASVGAGRWWRLAYGRVAIPSVADPVAMETTPLPAAGADRGGTTLLPRPSPKAIRVVSRPEELPAGVDPAVLAAGPLELRARRPGDVVRLPGGHRSLADVMIDARVPREARGGLALLARGDEVVWVEELLRPDGAGAVLVEDDDHRLMREALGLARAAAAAGELPVGALVVRDGEVLGRGANRTESDHDPTAHAEVLALREAAARVGDWRLGGATLVVTLEPCPMCFGALLAAHVGRVVYGAPNLREGALGGVVDLSTEGWKRRVEVRGGVRARESALMLSAFFVGRRATQG
jgi:tRNA(Ile)-lysidine synthase